MSSLRVTVLQEEFSSDNAHWIEKLLDAVSIVSVLPGRIRFHLGFEGDEILADTLRRELQKLESVRLETYSVRTRNVLVTFRPETTTELDVSTALLRGVREFARLHGECDLEHHHHEARAGHHHEEHEDDCDHDHSATSTDAGIRKELLKLLLSGGVLGYFIYKKVRGEKIAFYGNPLLDVASLVTIASGYGIFRAGVDTVQKHGKATDDTLISIAVLATLLMGESITGLSVVWLINLGRLLEAITLKRSRTAIKELMDIAPKEAWLVTKRGGKEKVERVEVESLEKGQVIRVFHSEKVPLDGRIIGVTSGDAVLVRESFITGEALPREKGAGQTVYAGSVLEKGDIDIEVTNLVHDTVVARMVDAIENLRDKKAPIERVGARFASQFVPISIGVSAATLLLTGDLRRAITMLVIACPCAAGLATPTAVSASIGQAARKGILIKGGTHLEMAAKVDTVVFDKTGTLTEGEPKLRQFIGTERGGELGEESCLRIAASAEQHTTHPLGLVLVREARKRGLELDHVNKFKLHPGLGISAQIRDASSGERSVRIGNLQFMRSEKIDVSAEFDRKTTAGFSPGESILFLAIDEKLHGAFIVHDAVRPEALDALVQLKKIGVRRIILATGDHRISADYVGRILNIEEIHSELLPANKLALIRELKSQGCKVAMIGDGVNDAQALAEADLSIAMGAGHCDIAIETADVTLARNDLMLVPETLDISRKTLKTIYQNFAAAVGINTGGMLFSASGKLTPFSAAIVHNASTIAVVLNSLRLGRQVAGSNPLQILSEVKI